MSRLSGALILLVLLVSAAAPATILPATGTFVCFCCIPIEDRPGEGAARRCTFPDWDPNGEFAHPRTGTLRLPVDESVPGSIRACVEYASTLGRAKGRIKVQVELLRENRVVDRAVFGGRVRKSARRDSSDLATVFYGCTKPSSIRFSLEAGDELVYRLKYRDFPELTKSGLFVLTAGVVR